MIYSITAICKLDIWSIPLLQYVNLIWSITFMIYLTNSNSLYTFCPTLWCSTSEMLSKTHVGGKHQHKTQLNLNPIWPIMGIQTPAPNTKLIISECVGPIGLTTHSRHASLLLGIHIYLEVGPAHFPITINTRHGHQLIRRMFKALQANWCREKTTYKGKCNNQYYIRSSIAIILLHLMCQIARKLISSNLAVQYYLGKKEKNSFHIFLEDI